MQYFCHPADVMYCPSFSMPNRAGIHSPYSAFLTNTLSNGFIILQFYNSNETLYCQNSQLTAIYTCSLLHPNSIDGRMKNKRPSRLFPK